MTFSDVLAAVRGITKDDLDEAQELKDDQYIQFLTDGMRTVWVECPSARLASGGLSLSTFTPPSAARPSDVLCIPDVFLPALIEYVLSRYYTRDSGDVRDRNRAAQHYQNFLRLSRGV